MTAPTEATVLRWGATAGFVGCFGSALWVLGVTAAPWVALLLGTLVFGIIMGLLWVKHLDMVEAARARAEGQGGTRLQVSDDDEPAGFASTVYDPDDD